MYILKFKNQKCWIANWAGDPGRTLVIDNAKKIKTRERAGLEAKKIIEENKHRKFELVVEEI